MRTNEMNMHHVDGGVYMTIITFGLYLVSVFGKISVVVFGTVTLQGIAGMMAILAAASTLILNAYRFYNDYKNNKNNKKT